MRLTHFLAGSFGVMGFVISIAAGLIADNSFEVILLRALLAAVVCYSMGYVVGLIAQAAAKEQAQLIASKVAKQDAEEEARRLAKEQEEAEQLNEALAAQAEEHGVSTKA